MGSQISILLPSESIRLELGIVSKSDIQRTIDWLVYHCEMGTYPFEGGSGCEAGALFRFNKLQKGAIPLKKNLDNRNKKKRNKVFITLLIVKQFAY